MNPNQLEVFKSIQSANRIVVLTGAGISTDSLIKDFRSQNGLWSQNEKWQDDMSKSYFNRRPKKFWLKYKEIFDLENMSKKKANKTHEFLVELENMGKEVSILTQNVDGLHQQAGSKRVIELHGNLSHARCPKCKRLYAVDYLLSHDIPRCSKTNGKGNVCGFILYPEAVLFGDKVNGLKESEQLIEEADLFLVMGTSLLVKPVNQLPKKAILNGVKSIYINRESVPVSEVADNDYPFDNVLLVEFSEIMEEWSRWKKDPE